MKRPVRRVCKCDECGNITPREELCVVNDGDLVCGKCRRLLFDFAGWPIEHDSERGS